jgi:hypothetical protein
MIVFAAFQRPASPWWNACRSIDSPAVTIHVLATLPSFEVPLIQVRFLFLQPRNPFQVPRELDGLSKTLVDLPKAALYAGAIAFLAVAGAAGALVGARAPGMACMAAQDQNGMIAL